jgi:nitrate/nitrite transporter NarK
VGVVLVALAPKGSRTPRRDVVARVFDRRLRPFAIWHSASFGLSVIVGNWIVTLLERAGSLSEHVAGVAGALVLAVGLVSRPLGGRFIDRPAVVQWSFVAGGAGVALLAGVSGLPLAIVACAVVGFAAGIPFAPSFAGAQRMRPDAPAAAIGAVNMAAAATILFGTPLLGLAFSLPGDGRIGFAAVAVLWAAAALTRPR